MDVAAPLASPPSVPPDLRWRRLGVGAGAMLAGRLTTAVCGLVQVPIALAHLGTEAFGLWLAATGFVWTLSILDCGLGFAVQNRLATLFGAGREAEAVALVRRTWQMLAVGAAIVATVGVPIAIWGRWDAWFGVTDPALRAQTHAAVAIAFTAAAVNLPLAFAARVAAALQLMWLTGLWTAVASVLGLAAVATAAWLGLPLAGFMVAACILPLAPHVGTWLHLRRRAAWLRRPTTTPPDLRGLARASVLFFMPQLGAAFIGSFVPTLVVFFAGPIAAATYGVLQRLFGLALQLQNMALLPTWPVYTQAAAASDATFMRRAFRATWMLTALVFVLPTMLLTPWVPAVVRLWLGASAPAISPALLWTMLGWHLLQYCGAPIAMVLNGVGRVGGLAVFGWICLLITLGLCTILGPRWGAAGVIVALAVPYALINLPLTGWQARHALTAVAPPAANMPENAIR
ncbi:MAG TPA: hypothetical protein VMC06_04920 [Opitutaceae bacterium]|nr:hypothetical protein [Opitutaceae bacterium]